MTSMPRRLLCLLLTFAPLTSSCATDGDGDDICTTLLLGAALVPCAVAWGVGCVAGAGTRCCEGPSAAEPAPASSPSESAPASTSTPLKASSSVEVAHVAY